MNATWEETDQDHIYEQKRKRSLLRRFGRGLTSWRIEIAWFLIGASWGRIFTHMHWIGF